jgi:hypothetical protein
MVMVDMDMAIDTVMVDMAMDTVMADMAMDTVMADMAMDTVMADMGMAMDTVMAGDGVTITQGSTMCITLTGGVEFSHCFLQVLQLDRLLRLEPE